MDGEGFDRFARALDEARSRRGAFASLLGGTLGLLGLAETGAKKHKKKKKKRKKTTPPPTPTCQPDAPATTCAGKCGAVTNTCGTSVTCESCCAFARGYDPATQLPSLAGLG